MPKTRKTKAVTPETRTVKAWGIFVTDLGVFCKGYLAATRADAIAACDPYEVPVRVTLTYTPPASPARKTRK